MEQTTPDLAELLMRTHHLMHRYHHLHQPEPACDSPGIDPRQGQGRLLMILQHTPDITQRDLTRLLGIRQQSLGELLTKLEKGGYITREPDVNDRRTMLVHVTEKGKGRLFHRVNFSKVFACLTEEEQAHMADYLQRLIASLTEQLYLDGDKPDFFCPPPEPWPLPGEKSR